MEKWKKLEFWKKWKIEKMEKFGIWCRDMSLHHGCPYTRDQKNIKNNYLVISQGPTKQPTKL